jgi:hypothetical protein
VLPSSKRPPRDYDDVVRTGDIEVVSSPSSSHPRPQRPDLTFGCPEDPTLARETREMREMEEKTRFFSAPSRSSMLPPRPVIPATLPRMSAPPAVRAPDSARVNLRGLVRSTQTRAVPQELTNLRGSVRPRPDHEDFTVLRPNSTIPPVSKPSSRPSASAPPAPVPVVPPSVSSSGALPVSLATRSPYAVERGSERLSDPGDPPSAVITARTVRPVNARSATSWAAGLVALGAIAGIVTAVVIRGDADSFVGATSSIIDPAHPTALRSSSAATQATILPTFVESTPPVTATAIAAPSTPPMPVAPVLATALPVASAPVVATTPAAAKPARPHGYFYGARPAPRPQPIADASPAAPAAAPTGWLANVTPSGAGAPITRPAKRAGEFENAAAASALAKAQLDASLR